MPNTAHSPSHTQASATARRHTWYPRLTTLIALSLLLAWLSGSVLAATETPDISGEWAMDKELSEDPTEKMREGRGGGMRGGGMGGGGRGGGGWGGGGWGGSAGGGRGGGRPGGMGGPGGQGPGQSREEMRERMQAMRASVERLQITQTDSSVRIVYADNRQQTLTTDNKKSLIETPFGEGTIKAKWREGGLVVKTKTDRRKTTETYYVTKDGSLLTVLVEMDAEGPMGSTSFKRLYRPADPEVEMEAESTPG